MVIAGSYQTMASSAMEVSVIGARFVFNHHTPPIRRIIWGVLILFGTGCSFYLVGNQIFYFLEKPVAIDQRVVSPKRLEFPSLTLCADAVQGMHWLKENQKSPVEVRDLRLFFGYSFASLSCAQDILGSKSCSGVIQSIKRPLTDAELVEFLEASTEHLLASCVFRGKPCPQKATPLVTEQAACLATGSVNASDPWYVVGSGSSQGIQLLAAIHKEDILTPTERLGFVLHLSEPGDVQFQIRDDLLLIPPFHQTFVTLKKKRVSMLEEKSGCNSSASYRFSFCKLECLSRLTTYCNCTLPGIPRDSPAPLCDSISGMACLIKSYLSLGAKDDVLHSCHCPAACDSVIYEKTVTSSPLSPTYILLLAMEQGWISPEQIFSYLSASNSSAVASFNSSLIAAPLHFLALLNEAEVLGLTATLQIIPSMITIYYSSLDYEHTEQTLSYSFWTLMSDIGGALGLFLGSAIYTVVEVADYLLFSPVLRGYGRKSMRMS